MSELFQNETNSDEENEKNRNRTAVNSHQFSSFIAVNECFRKKFTVPIKDPKQCFMWHMWKCFFTVHVCVCVCAVAAFLPSLSLSFHFRHAIENYNAKIRSQSTSGNFIWLLFVLRLFWKLRFLSFVPFISWHAQQTVAKLKSTSTLGPFLCHPLFNYIWNINGFFYGITIFQSIFNVYWLLRRILQHYLFFTKYGKLILMNKAHDYTHTCNRIVCAFATQLVLNCLRCKNMASVTPGRFRHCCECERKWMEEPPQLTWSIKINDSMIYLSIQSNSFDGCEISFSIILIVIYCWISATKNDSIAKIVTHTFLMKIINFSFRSAGCKLVKQFFLCGSIKDA